MNPEYRLDESINPTRRQAFYRLVQLTTPRLIEAAKNRDVSTAQLAALAWMNEDDLEGSNIGALTFYLMTYLVKEIDDRSTFYWLTEVMSEVPLVAKELQPKKEIYEKVRDIFIEKGFVYDEDFHYCPFGITLYERSKPKLENVKDDLNDLLEQAGMNCSIYDSAEKATDYFQECLSKEMFDTLLIEVMDLADKFSILDCAFISVLIGESILERHPTLKDSYPTRIDTSLYACVMTKIYMGDSLSDEELGEDGISKIGSALQSTYTKIKEDPMVVEQFLSLNDTVMSKTLDILMTSLNLEKDKSGNYILNLSNLSKLGSVVDISYLLHHYKNSKYYRNTQ